MTLDAEVVLGWPTASPCELEQPRERARTEEGGDHRHSTNTANLSHRRVPPKRDRAVRSSFNLSGPYLHWFPAIHHANGTSMSLGLPRRTRRHRVSSRYAGSSAECRFDVGPVVVDPSGEGGEGLFEGSAEVGEHVEGSGVDTAGIKVAHKKAVALGSSESVGEHFV